MSRFSKLSDPEFALKLLDWHGGGGSALYALGSTLYARHEPSVESVRASLRDLRVLVETAVEDNDPAQTELSELYDELARRYSKELVWANPQAALGPSLDYSHNVPEGGIPPEAPPDQELDPSEAGLVFSMQTCDHTELDPEVIARIDELKDQAEETGVVPETDNPLVNAGLQVEIIGEDQGPLPPPWARYAETFGADIAMTLPRVKSVFEEAREFQEHQQLVAANPKKASKKAPIIKAEEFVRRIQEGERFTAKQIEISTQNILGTNPKLSKGDLCFLSIGLSLAPWGLSGVTNLCPYASKGCAFGCLNVSGNAEVYDTPEEARKRRTLLFMYNRPEFTKTLERGMAKWQGIADENPAEWSDSLAKVLGGRGECSRHDLVLRMNVLSDLPWEQIKLTWPDGQVATWPERYPTHQFYDYTKNPDRMLRFLQFQNGAPVEWPANYYLTFSWSEINAPFAFHVLDQGGNVAIAFDTNSKVDYEPLPPVWCGYPVIDADESDMRFLDNDANAALRQQFGTGLICGLRLKGTTHMQEFWARKQRELEQRLSVGTLTGGFVQYADDAGMRGRAKKAVYDESLNITLNPEYKATLIELAEQRAQAQAQDPQGWKGKGFRGLSPRAQRVLE